ncbi:hypothetical protein BD626DRAFT_549799 [Schizophyllum amplum]|uniref:J domain-containing protein n=1 Tax=Schizophyllum amplum TaxID=97359 RepID=A0A550C5R0_9AGAR|nr:hypothetical protein BD626DRAFT_549799 [Auriculariopsis ampla]
MRVLALASVLLFALRAYADASAGGLYPPGLAPLINRANVLLSSGQFNDAPSSITADYLLYWKRATAYYSLNRYNSALDDFEKARSTRRRASSTRRRMRRTTPRRAACRDRAGASSGEEGRMEHKSQLWTACVEDSSAALRTASTHRDPPAARGVRAGGEDIEGAVADMTRLTHLLPPSTDLFVRIFRLSYFFLPNSGASTNPLKQCLHQDPDSKPCFKLHKLAKNLDKASGKNNDVMNRFDEALQEHAQRELLFSPRRQTLVRALCKAYMKAGQTKKAEPWCETLLGMSGCSEDLDGLEEYQEAIRVFEKAFEASGRSDRDIHQRMQKAQKLLKQSKQKDYYKILGVPRDADDRTIKKAFRTAAKTAHPDKGGSEAKMAAVNEAYETLSDPELRARFDAGDDPNDPQGGQQHPFTGFGGGGHPFAQFFQQSGGHGGFPGGGHGGGSYQFHFGH